MYVHIHAMPSQANALQVEVKFFHVSHLENRLLLLFQESFQSCFSSLIHSLDGPFVLMSLGQSQVVKSLPLRSHDPSNQASADDLRSK